MTRTVAIPYAVHPAILVDTASRRLLGEVVGLSGQPVSVYELRPRRGRRRHDGRLRKRMR
jgi:hypothetical protein